MVARIIGTGSFLPEHIITNDDLSNIVETNDEWIRTRTGILTRRVATDLTTTAIAANAGQKAIENAGISPQDIDYIIVATLSPDNYVPNTSCMVQKELGAVNATCMDLNAACSGFLFALNTAHAYIASGMAKNILIIGAELLSKYIDWHDRTTCVLFGDGAGAAVIAADTKGFLDTVTGSDGLKSSSLTCAARPLSNFLAQKDEQKDYIKMDGEEVFKFALRKVPECIREVLEKTGTDINEISHFILHQANIRIIQSVAKRLNVDFSRFPINLDSFGNTSAASIPILLDECNRTNILQKGEKLVICGFGGGLTWGAAVLYW